MTLSSWFKLIVEILWKSRQSICVFRICLLRLSCSCDKCRGRGGLTALMFEVNWCAAFSNPDCRLWALFTRAGPANLWNTHLASWQIGNDGSTNPTIRKIWQYGGSDTIHSGHQTFNEWLEFMLSLHWLQKISSFWLIYPRSELIDKTGLSLTLINLNVDGQDDNDVYDEMMIDNW